MQAVSDIADLLGMTHTRRDEGFTMVELLVVMLIIGVLAAIAVPSFVSQKDKAYRSTLVSDAKALMTAQTTRQVDQVSYTEDVAELEASGFKRSAGVEEPVIKVAGGTYTACMKHASLSKWLVLDGDDQATSWAEDGSACA